MARSGAQVDSCPPPVSASDPGASAVLRGGVHAARLAAVLPGRCRVSSFDKPLYSDEDGRVIADGVDPLPDEPMSELGYTRRLIAVYVTGSVTSRRGSGGWCGTTGAGRTTPTGKPPGG
jgi:hypothetical protein